ncbi:MAG: hypothetical protein MK095_02110 [Phycisphaerales bacterium]|nr:hypothetical protein [Phycisphaerales bacterium]
MSRTRDIVDIQGFESPKAEPNVSTRPFLSIWYRCCNTYGRLYRNASATQYEGRCPRCGAQARVGIGPHGSTSRVFEAS